MVRGAVWAFHENLQTLTLIHLSETLHRDWHDKTKEHMPTSQYSSARPPPINIVSMRTSLQDLEAARVMLAAIKYWPCDLHTFNVFYFGSFIYCFRLWLVCLPCFRLWSAYSLIRWLPYLPHSDFLFMFQTAVSLLSMFQTVISLLSMI